MPTTNIIAEIAREFESGNNKDVVDVIAFCESNWGLNLKLRPVQAFVLRCMYGLPLLNGSPTIKIPDITNEHILYEMNEADFLQWLYAEKRTNVQKTEGRVFNELVWVAGRRAGKSLVAACIANYEIYKLVYRVDPAKYYGHQAGSKSYLLNAAPSDGQAEELLEMMSKMAEASPYLKDRVIHNTAEYFDIATDHDFLVNKNSTSKPRPSIEVLAGGCSSNSLRGNNAITIIMDEMAYFIDNDGRFSGAEVYKALTPSLASFRRDGKTLCLSSPYARFGKFYEVYQESLRMKDEKTEEKDGEETKEKENNILMFKMYSSMVNPTIAPQILAAARRRDRVSFMCEYGAEFSDTITAWVDDDEEFKRCVIPYTPPTHGRSDIAYYYGIDLGFKNDGTAVSIVHKDRDSGKIILDYSEVWFSASSDVWEDQKSIYRNCNKYATMELLKMADFVAEVKALTKWFPPKEGIFDQSNGYGLAELFSNERMKQFKMDHFSDIMNSDIYRLAKRLYSEGLLELYNHPVLIPEMLALECERKVKREGPTQSDDSRGKIEVRAPIRRGAHDDISESYVRAVYLCYNGYKDKVPNRSVVGGGGAARSAYPRGTETQAGFNLRRLKRHGEHPRLSKVSVANRV